jgi:hypothetical protein
MRRSVQLATVGVAVLVAGGGAATAHAALTPQANPVIHHGAARWHGSCRTTATPADLAAPRIPMRSTRSGRRDHSGETGTIAVGIPSAVFIRASGPALTVTTNTGRAPRAGNTFYYVANGRADMASTELIRRIDATCGRSSLARAQP